MGKTFFESLESRIRVWIARKEPRMEKVSSFESKPVNPRVGCSIVHEEREGKK